MIGGLQTPATAWTLAVTSASMYTAVTNTDNEEIDFQQLAISYAAPNALTWIFHGTRLAPYIDQTLENVRTQILDIDAHINPKDASAAGVSAAQQVIAARIHDGMIDFVEYIYHAATPGFYQLTNPAYGLPPDGPQVPFARMFNNLTATDYQASPPPAISDPAYEGFVLDVKAIGNAASTTRTPDQTDIALFWRESAPM